MMINNNNINNNFRYYNNNIPNNDINNNENQSLSFIRSNPIKSNYASQQNIHNIKHIYLSKGNNRTYNCNNSHQMIANKNINNSINYQYSNPIYNPHLKKQQSLLYLSSQSKPQLQYFQRQSTSQNTINTCNHRKNSSKYTHSRQLSLQSNFQVNSNNININNQNFQCQLNQLNNNNMPSNAPFISNKTHIPVTATTTIYFPKQCCQHCSLSRNNSINQNKSINRNKSSYFHKNQNFNNNNSNYNDNNDNDDNQFNTNYFKQNKKQQLGQPISSRLNYKDHNFQIQNNNLTRVKSHPLFFNTSNQNLIVQNTQDKNTKSYINSISNLRHNNNNNNNYQIKYNNNKRQSFKKNNHYPRHIYNYTFLQKDSVPKNSKPNISKQLEDYQSIQNKQFQPKQTSFQKNFIFPFGQSRQAIIQYKDQSRKTNKNIQHNHTYVNINKNKNIITQKCQHCMQDFTAKKRITQQNNYEQEYQSKDKAAWFQKRQQIRSKIKEQQILRMQKSLQLQNLRQQISHLNHYDQKYYQNNQKNRSLVDKISNKESKSQFVDRFIYDKIIESQYQEVQQPIIHQQFIRNSQQSRSNISNRSKNNNNLPKVQFNLQSQYINSQISKKSNYEKSFSFDIQKKKQLLREFKNAQIQDIKLINSLDSRQNCTFNCDHNYCHNKNFYNFKKKDNFGEVQDKISKLKIQNQKLWSLIHHHE